MNLDIRGYPIYFFVDLDNIWIQILKLLPVVDLKQMWIDISNFESTYYKMIIILII